MEEHRARLSSASTTLGELVARITASAEGFEAAGEEALAAELFEVERSLRVAERRLGGVLRRLR